MALQQLRRCASREDGFQFLMANLPLFDKLLQVFFDEMHIGGYEIVGRMFMDMAKFFPDPTMKLFVSKEDNAKISSFFDARLVDSSETLRIRLLDLFASLSTISTSWFEALDAKGFIAKIFAELDTDDLLSRLNAFQLLGKVCTSDRGMDTMKENQVPEKLIVMLDLEASGLHNIVLSNVITLIGELASFSQKSFNTMVGEHLEVITAMHAHMEHDSDEVVQAIIFALARICCTPSGISLLLQDSYSTVVRDWLEFGHSSNAEMKATTFYSISLILDRLLLYPDAHAMAHMLYSRLGFPGYPSIEVVHKSLNGALSELKYAALTLLKSTLQYDWGLEECIRFPGLSEWMVNRGTENTKKGHELKFEVIQQALQHPQSKTLLGIGNYHIFLEYVKLGVYYQRAEAAVMIRDEHG